MTRARGSPKIPVTTWLGRNPGKAYRSQSRRFRRRRGIGESCVAPPRLQAPVSPTHPRLLPPSILPNFTHSIGRRATKKERGGADVLVCVYNDKRDELFTSKKKNDAPAEYKLNITVPDDQFVVRGKVHWSRRRWCV